MLSLTRKTDYALVALAFLGQQRQSGGKPVSARLIADQFGLPLPLLMNILKDMAHAELVRSTRGAQGGYVLSQAPQRITLAKVVSAIEGRFNLTQCTGPEDTDAGPRTRGAEVLSDGCCQLVDSCPISAPIRRLHDRIAGFLETVTLADLMDAKVDVTLERVGV